MFFTDEDERRNVFKKLKFFATYLYLHLYLFCCNLSPWHMGLFQSSLYVGCLHLYVLLSGGTDIISCFAGNNPTLPVYKGEIQSRLLGMAVESWNDEGS